MRVERQSIYHSDRRASFLTSQRITTLAIICYLILLSTAGAVLAMAPARARPRDAEISTADGPPPLALDLGHPLPASASPRAEDSQLQSTFCSGDGELVYRIDEMAFRPYSPACVYADHCTLLAVPSPPAPLGWNQPGFQPDERWVPPVRVWWDVWRDPGWDPEWLACGRPTGLYVDGKQDGQNGTTHLVRRLFSIAEPPGKHLKQAVLHMWSDNKSEWWWDGRSVRRDQEAHVDSVYLTDRISERLQGGTEASFLLAIQVSNDWVPQGPGTDGNPMGLAYRLELTWESRNRLYLPVLVRKSSACSWHEEFTDPKPYTAIPPDRPPGQITSGAATITLSGTGSRYLWRQVPVLSTGDFTVTAVLSLRTERSDGGVALALRSGSGLGLADEHVIDPGHPGLMIGIAHNETRCQSAFDHIFAEWITEDGKDNTTHTGCIQGRSNGLVIPIAQQSLYEAQLEILRSQKKVILTVFGPTGTVTQSLQISSTVTSAPLDTLVIGHALRRSYRTDREFDGRVDSVAVVSTDCSWNSRSDQIQ